MIWMDESIARIGNFTAWVAGWTLVSWRKLDECGCIRSCHSWIFDIELVMSCEDGEDDGVMDEIGDEEHECGDDDDGGDDCF